MEGGEIECDSKDEGVVHYYSRKKGVKGEFESEIKYILQQKNGG